MLNYIEYYTIIIQVFCDINAVIRLPQFLIKSLELFQVSLNVALCFVLSTRIDKTRAFFFIFRLYA